MCNLGAKLRRAKPPRYQPAMNSRRHINIRGVRRTYRKLARKDWLRLPNLSAILPF